MSDAVRASRLAGFLGLALAGPDVEVRAVRPLSRAEPGALVFAKAFSEEAAVRIEAQPGVLAIVHPEFRGRLTGAHVVSENPRLDFARAAAEFFDPRPRGGWVAPTALVAPGAVLGANVRVGHHSVVEDGVVLAEGVEVRDHVILRRGTRVGARSVVKSHTVVGEEGFGFEYDDAGRPIRIPHFGGVEIGEDVEVGAMNVIARGTLDDTVLADHVKTDDHVFIAHNARIGRGSVIIACAEVSGSCELGEGVWVAPSACIINKAKVGDRALVGMGAVVTKDVEAGMIVAGNPARVIRAR
jgi:UDP-3-O-[3-hydroxymyristoyl] glucosamine N-acyltransferase